MNNSNKVNKAILIGRHAPVGLPKNIKIVQQLNVEWPTNAEQCQQKFIEVAALAAQLSDESGKCAVLLQNVPGILAVVIADLYYNAGYDKSSQDVGLPSGVTQAMIDATKVRVGFIISVPGERKAGVEDWSIPLDEPAAQEVARMVKAANGRATVEVIGDRVKLTVDPVSKFEFSHIEWL